VKFVAKLLVLNLNLSVCLSTRAHGTVAKKRTGPIDAEDSECNSDPESSRNVITQQEGMA